MFSKIPLLAAILLASPAFAEEMDPGNDVPEIVVEADRDQIRQFIDALTDAPIGGQLSRFDWSVCPVAVGLLDRQNIAVADRMRHVAAAAGIKVAPAGCKPNALLIVADNKQELIDGLWKRYPQYFVDQLGRRAKPGRQPGPVSAWHLEALLDSNGHVPGQELLWRFYVTSSMDSSRLIPGALPYFVAGITVIERNALAGLTTTQVADYAAMRIFARTDPARLKKPAPTILTVIDAPMGSATPLTLTEWDLGYLKALYSSGRRQFASSQRHEMQQRILRKDVADRSSEAK